MAAKRRRHTAACELRLSLKALGGSRPISHLSSEYEVHADQIRASKRQRLADLPDNVVGPKRQITEWGEKGASKGMR